MTTRTRKPIRRLTACLLVLVALGVAACGSNASSSSTHSAASSPPATTTTSASSSSSGGSSASSSNGIPQGNVGDDDSDNHGGPSDGDGNL